MRIVGMIPARLNSSRFPGKVLALLGDRPLLWHVFDAARLSGVFDDIFVVCDHDRIWEVCRGFGIPCLMTGDGHLNPTSRIWEAAGQVDADFFVMMGADEPLVAPGDIRSVVDAAVDAMGDKAGAHGPDRPCVVNAMAAVSSAPEVFDPGNIKIVCRRDGRGLYASRGPIPYPKGSLDYSYRKFVSIGVYTKEALEFFASTLQGRLEQIEEFDLLRFMEHGKFVLFVDITGFTLSVDTPKDLERVRKIFSDGSGRSD